MKKNKKFKKNSSQSSFAKLSIFNNQKFKFKKKCPLSGKSAPIVDYKNIRLCVVPFLALSTPHFIKVVESSDSGNLKSNYIVFLKTKHNLH